MLALMNNSTVVNLSHFTSGELLRGKFISFFIDSNSSYDTSTVGLNRDAMLSCVILQMFRPVSADEVKDITMKSPQKSRDLDPVSTWHLNKHLNQHFRLITAIINKLVAESVI